MKREPAEPQGFIKPTGVGISRLQAGEEVNNHERQTIVDAPATVMRAVETSRRGHELFDRVRDEGVVVYGLRRA